MRSVLARISPWLALLVAAYVGVLTALRALPSGVAVDRWTQIHPDGSATPVRLPAHVAADGDYVLRADVQVHDADGALLLPHLSAPVDLYIDGEAIVPVMLDPRLEYRPHAVHAWTIPAEVRGRTASFELRVQRTWAQATWIDLAPRLTPHPKGGAHAAVLAALEDYVAPGACFILGALGLTYGVVFLADRRRRGHGWFAVQAVTACSYALFLWGPSQLLFGRAWDLTSIVVGLSLAIYSSVLFTREQAQLGPPSPLWTVAAAGLVILGIWHHDPFRAQWLAARATVLFVAVGHVWQISTLLRLLARPSPPRHTGTLLAAWLVLGATAWPDCAAWLGWGEPTMGARLVSVGLTLFGVLQSVALSRDYAAAHVEAERLNAELRHQIRARTAELSDALSRLALAQPASLPIREGDIVEDRYRVRRVLGSGGMGVVYEASRLEDAKPVALKVLTGTPTVEHLARFAREAKLAASVDHPNVVHVLDAGVARGGYLFLAMELVSGSALNRLKERYGDVPWAVSVIARVARGLAAIHAEGIVHRDLKPGNILVRDQGGDVPEEVKITDFGISTGRLQSEAEPSTGQPTRPVGPTTGARPDAEAPLTVTGHLLGTPAYMSPEVLRHARAATAASDVYGLGVVAYELLRGERPFDDVGAAAHAAGVLLDDPESLRGAIGDLALEALLDQALASDPSRRPTASAIADAAESAIPRVAGSRRSVGLALQIGETAREAKD